MDIPGIFVARDALMVRHACCSSLKTLAGSSCLITSLVPCSGEPNFSLGGDNIGEVGRILGAISRKNGLGVLSAPTRTCTTKQK